MSEGFQKCTLKKITKGKIGSISVRQGEDIIYSYFYHRIHAIRAHYVNADRVGEPCVDGVMMMICLASNTFFCGWKIKAERLRNMMDLT